MNCHIIRERNSDKTVKLLKLAIFCFLVKKKQYIKHLGKVSYSPFKTLMLLGSLHSARAKKNSLAVIAETVQISQYECVHTETWKRERKRTLCNQQCEA